MIHRLGRSQVLEARGTRTPIARCGRGGGASGTPASTRCSGFVPEAFKSGTGRASRRPSCQPIADVSCDRISSDVHTEFAGLSRARVLACDRQFRESRTRIRRGDSLIPSRVEPGFDSRRGRTPTARVTGDEHPAMQLLWAVLRGPSSSAHRRCTWIRWRCSRHSSSIQFPRTTTRPAIRSCWSKSPWRG